MPATQQARHLRQKHTDMEKLQPTACLMLSAVWPSVVPGPSCWAQSAEVNSLMARALMQNCTGLAQ